MARLDQFWDNSTPWDGNLTDLKGQELTIEAIEPTTTTYGPGYLVTLTNVTVNGTHFDKFIAVTSNKVVVNQLRALEQAEDAGEAVFPMCLRLTKIKGRENSYFQLADVEDKES